jgi:hypothetical protein
MKRRNYFIRCLAVSSHLEVQASSSLGNAQDIHWIEGILLSFN